MEIPEELKAKAISLMEKIGLSPELASKIKEVLSKGASEVEVTKVEVSKPEDKNAFKKHLEECMKEESDEEPMKEEMKKPTFG